MVKSKSGSMASIIYFLSRGTFLGIGVYNVLQFSKQDSYLSSIIGFLIGYLPLLIILYITKNKEDIFTLNVQYFKKIGILFNFILSIATCLFAGLLIYNLSNFLVMQYMPETPQIYIQILLGIGIVYVLNKGIQNISNLSQVLIYISITFFLFTILGVLDKIEFSNMLPIMESGIKKNLLGSIIYGIFTSLPIFLITAISRKELADDQSFNKDAIKAYTLGSVMMILNIFLIVVVLSPTVAVLDKFPEYMLLKKISVLKIIERVENIATFQFFIDSFMLIIMSLYFSYKNFSNYVKKSNYKKMIIVLIVIIPTLIINNIFINKTELIKFSIQYLPYIIVGIVVPFITLVGIVTFVKNLNIKRQEKIANNIK